jgi:hypothetical protein
MENIDKQDSQRALVSILHDLVEAAVSLVYVVGCRRKESLS